MTVAELIEKLKALPQDLVCVAPGVGSQEDNIVSVERIEIVEATEDRPGIYSMPKWHHDDPRPTVRVVRVSGSWAGPSPGSGD